MTRQSVRERATGTNKTPRCMIQEPEWPVNPSQGGAVHLAIIFSAQPSGLIARCFCPALGHCTLWAHSTAAESSLQAQNLWVWNAIPKQHQLSCVLHREMLFFSPTKILQINLYLMQKKYNYADNVITSKAEICFISPLFLKKQNS